MTDTMLQISELTVQLGGRHVLQDFSLSVGEGEQVLVTAPSGTGKSTLLRCFNRLNDLVDDVRIEGNILFEGEKIYDPELEINALRKRIGMVFQKSNPFPKSIYENVAYGCRIQGINGK